MSILRCGLLLSVLSYQLLTLAVAQNVCPYTLDRNGICRTYADCKELHGKLIFRNPACKANTFCCPINLVTPPLFTNINNFEPEVNPDYENPPLPDEIMRENFNDVLWTPAANPNRNQIYASEPVPQVNLNRNYPWGADKHINTQIGLPGIPVDPYSNVPWVEVKPKNPTIVLSINLPKDSPEVQENQEDIIYGNQPDIKINPIEPFENGPRFQDHTISAPPIQVGFSAIPTTPKPITTTTEAIPIFSAEFYRRLGLAFGDKYNIYKQPDAVTPENDIQNDQTVNVVIEEVSTNTTHFMDNLNQLGLHTLSLEKCGFVHFQNDPSQSNVDAHLLEFPWLALLHYDGEPKSINFSCGGSLISARWVLTAASCVTKSLIGVRLGEYEISEKSNRDCVKKSCAVYKDYKIATMIKHPDYKPEMGVKDIALIKLKTRAQKSKNIKPICLPTKMEHFNVPYNNTDLTITGWGLNKIGATKVMKKHAINRSKLQTCHQANPAQPEKQSKMCLTTRNEEPSTCSGDPGSPISWIVNDGTEFITQIGIVPFGMDKCGAADGVVSSYYVESVADSMDWITKVIGEE